MQTVYDVLVAEDYTDRNGKSQRWFTQIGIAYDAKGGGMDIKLRALPVPGRDGKTFVMVRPRREREQGQERRGAQASEGRGGGNAEGGEDDIPF